MPCKIKIKEIITSIVENETDSALDKTLNEAQVIANNVNSEFGEEVVSFSQATPETLSREITVSDELVEVYYDNESRLELERTPAEEQQGPEDSGSAIFAQTAGMRASKANTETLDKVKEVMKKMGVSFQALHDYAKSNRDVDTKDVNGLADLTKKVIAVAQGYENVALTEEMVHIATAILEQTNPKMITSLISQIENYKIYKSVFDEYKNRKEYQLANGKPDIRKIKKEAVDKLLAEVIVYQSEGSTDFPELVSQVEREVVEGWWEAVLKWLRDNFSKTKVDLFDVADVIIKGDFGTVDDIKLGGVYLQKAPSKVGDNPSLDDYYDVVAGYSERLEVVPETPEKKRHYMLDKIVEVAKSVTEKLGATKSFPDRTEIQKKIDDQKKTWGDVGHKYIEKYIKMNLIDADGFKKKFTNDTVSTTLDLDAQEALIAFCEELINSYPEGTRFLVEREVINMREKGLLASTIDFMAIVPTVKEGGIKSFVVDILDWKFTDIDKSYEDDVPWYKQDAWRPQMAEYVKMMYEYGLKPGQVRKSRMVPFIMNYVDIIKGDSESGKRPSSIEIGRLDEAKETKMYLLPVPTYSETTGNPIVDDLLSVLRTQWTKLYKTGVEPEQKGPKITKLHQLSGAIRSLHVKLNFEPLVNVGRTYLETSKSTIKSFKGLDYSKLTKSQIEDKLQELLDLKGLSESFVLLDEAFISEYGEENLSDTDKKTLKELKNIASNAKAKRKEILKLQKTYLAYLAEKENVVGEGEADVLFKAEKEIGRFVKTFVEGSRLPAKLINFASNLIMRSKKLADQKFIEHFTDFSKLLMALETSASAQGKKAFELIGTVDNNGLRLIKKVDPAFWEALTKAKADKNKKFLLENIDKDEYMKLANEAAAKSIKEFELMQFSTDPKQDRYLRNLRIKNVKKTLDITRSDFTGYDNKTFSYLLSKSLKTENHLSPEYKQMAGDKASLDMWDFFTSLNEKAKSIGYIDEQGMSFFPLIEASILDKFSQSTDLLGETKDFFKDLYSVKSFEKQQYSAKDEETGKVDRTLPKYFTTKGSTPVERLSMDLNKVGALWIKALTDYESKQTIENTVLTMLAVEQSKGALITNEQGDLVTEGGHLKVDKKSQVNASVFQEIVDDAFYGLENDLNSFGNISIKAVASKLGGTEETKEQRDINIKKGLDNANTWVRSLAVGLKPLIAISNFVGYNFHALIEGGQMYNWTEFVANGVQVTVGTGLTLEDKALLYQVTLGTDNTMEEVRRRLAWDQGLHSYLSTWSFTDAMMLFNSFPDRKANLANAKSFNDNAIIIDGKILNARQHLRELDRKSKYKKGVSNTERTNLEKSFEERLKTLLENSTRLTSAVKVVNDKIIIENVSDEEIAKYSLMVSEFARKLSGQMNDKNKAGYRRDAIFSSFMMFKNWIPKLVTSRAGDLRKNMETGEWEYGRTRVMAKVLLSLGNDKIETLSAIIKGDEKGLEFLRKMLENKKREHLLNTGEELIITDEEFFDLVRTQINNEFKELGLLFGTFALVFAFGFLKPPEDASDLEKNRWKWWAKAFNKINEELSFYYLPTSADAITKGSFFPPLGILAKAGRALKAFYDETEGFVMDDQKTMDDAYPVKYSLNLIPGLSQFMTELLPYLHPELAKELGVRVTEQSRRQ